MPIASPKLLILNHNHSSERFFWSNPYKIEVKITSLIEMLGLPNFSHMATSTIWFESHNKILWRHGQKLCCHNLHFKMLLRWPGVAIFADIIKIVTMFIKTIFKDSRKVKRIRNYVSKCNLYLYFLIAEFADFWWRIADVSRAQEQWHVIHIFFGSFLSKV